MERIDQLAADESDPGVRVLVTAVFDTLTDGADACEALVRAGLAKDSLSAVLAEDLDGGTPSPDQSKALAEREAPRAPRAASLGAIVGASTMGLAATSLAIPGIVAIGPIVALLAGAGLGAAAGGALGALVGIGVSRDIAEVYHRSLAGGAVMVGVEAGVGRREEVEALLAMHGGRSIHAVEFVD
ncbi:MAG: hypothetical protein R3F56_08905 [Planctomycetota bacterium]